MNSQERLMRAVINGDLSVIDDVLAENFNVHGNSAEALRAANMKLFEARSKSLEAESIVDMLKIKCAANQSPINNNINEDMPLYKLIHIMAEDMPLYKLIQIMSEDNEEAKKILSDIAKQKIRSLSKLRGYIIMLDKLDIRGADIVSAYEFCGSDMSRFFDVLDHESDKLISHLAECTREDEKGAAL